MCKGPTEKAKGGKDGGWGWWGGEKWWWEKGDNCIRKTIKSDKGKKLIKNFKAKVLGVKLHKK